MGGAQTQFSTKLSHFPQVKGPQASWPGFMEFLLPAIWSLKAIQSGLRDHTTGVHSPGLDGPLCGQQEEPDRPPIAPLTFSGIILCNFLVSLQRQARGEEERGSVGWSVGTQDAPAHPPPIPWGHPRAGSRVLQWGGLRTLRDTSPNAAEPGRFLEDKGTQGQAGAAAAVCVRSILGLVSQRLR